MLNTSLSNFTGLQIKLASPEEILSWSKGEVTKPETINYRTFRPEKDGLFCEKIFGPVKDYECFCGKYKKIRYKGIICDKCGVEVTTSKVRRERMGHIALVAPVAHLWYLKNSPSPMGVILDIPQKDLEAVVYFTKFLVTEVNPDARKEAVQNLTDNSKKRQLEIDEQTKAAIAARKEQIDEEKKSQAKKIKNKEQLLLADKELDNRLKQDIQKMENKSISEKNKIQSLIQFLEETVQSLDVLTVLTDEEMYYLETFKADIFFKAEMGAEAVHKVLGKIDTDATIEKVAKEADKTSSRLKKRKLMYKLRILRGMRESGVNPQWMIMKVVPIIPPDLRPMVQLTGGRFATSDLNDLYRRVINRNNRLKKLIRLGAPDIILRNEKRMLQEVVDMLIDSTKTMKNRRKTLKRTPRSLSDMLKGKKGRFRRNLLGKRVDYSARSAIVVGPELKLNQVGLPKEIAIEIYRPFLLRELMVSGVAPNIKSAKNMIDNKAKEVYDILDHVTKGSYVLLNRAPTLHKLSILAFKPILVDGLAIRLHPSVCEGFNADFDGDQMGVHLPLSAASLKEAKKYMLPSKNLLKASDGTPVALPSKEMAIGIYYMTSIREEDLEKAKSDKLEGVPVLGSKREAILAYQSGKITMRELVVVKIEGKMEKTTYGRILFNSNLPKGLPFQNYALSGGKQTRELTLYIMETLGRKAVVKLVDALKNLGFLGTTLSGLSLSIKDTGMLPDKNLIIKAADLKVAEIQDSFNMGLISSGEKTRLTNQVWMDVTEDIADKTWQTLSIDSPIRLISGAGIKRASKDQIKQLSGMRGLVVDPTGRIVPLPTKSSFRQGLSTFEYVTGARGARKGLADTALKTADAGYLTRKLVDATHSCIIRQEDCGTTKGLIIDRNEKGRERVFGRRIGGRILSADVVDSKGVVIAPVGTTVNDDVVKLIEASDAHIIEVRSPLTCQTRYGLCQKCYGWDLSTRKPVEIGVPVGVIAAQSIGEPGTQLTMRTKHTGGVVGVDVTQGLPRVQELFEMRTPKMPSPLAELGGKVKLKETNDGFEVSITGKDEEGKAKTVTYLLPIGATMLVGDGDLIAAGTQLTMGSLDVKQIKEVLGHLAAQRYLINGIQAVYESQGIGIHDKHFEVLVKEMTNKVRISDPGETLFAYGQVVSDSVYATENEKAKLAGKRPAKGVKSLLGLIQSSLTTNSWLSAASFQQTTTTLTEASLVGSIDNLIGLKENVIIGRLIPVGKNQQIL